MKSFIPWLRTQVKRNDPVGDLARDVVADLAYCQAGKEFHIARGDKHPVLTLAAHIHRYHSPVDGVWPTLAEAFEEWKVYKTQEMEREI